MSKNGRVSDIEAALSTVADTEQKEIYTLSTGVRVRFKPVNSMLVQKAMNRIPDPPVPIVVDEQQGRDYENPDDPKYIKEMSRVTVQRGYARLNTLILWGMELVDGAPDPEEDDWLYRLQFQERQGDIDLSDFDFNNPIDREFAYKKFIAIGDALTEDGINSDVALVLNLGQVSGEAIEQASDTFQGEETQPANSDSTPEKSEVVS